MKVNSYRVEKEREDGTFCGCTHFTSIWDAKKYLDDHKIFIETSGNLIPTPEYVKYGTIWESSLKCYK